MISSAVLLISCVPTITANAEAKPKLLALAFDDGPNTTTTNEVLDVLYQYNAKATFFLIGLNINDESAKSVKRAYDMGMEIGSNVVKNMINDEFSGVRRVVCSTLNRFANRRGMIDVWPKPDAAAGITVHGWEDKKERRISRFLSVSLRRIIPSEEKAERAILN